MLSTRKPEEPNFNFNHVRGSQEAFGEPRGRVLAPGLAGQDLLGPNTATKSGSPAPRLRPTRFPEGPGSLWADGLGDLGLRGVVADVVVAGNGNMTSTFELKTSD